MCFWRYLEGAIRIKTNQIAIRKISGMNKLQGLHPLDPAKILNRNDLPAKYCGEET
jgi:hypothetical protein